jgi:hypothetical protein
MTVFSSANAQRFGVTLSLLLCLAPLSAHAQKAAPPAGSSRIVPMSDPAYKNVDTLQRIGIVIGYPRSTTTGRPSKTRADFAREVSHLLLDLMPPARYAVSVQHLARQVMQADLRQHKAARDALRRLVVEFAPELTVMGQNVAAAQAALAEIHPISPPFSDVPKTHWAYQAVNMLRKAGIVIGEGDGRFLSRSHGASQIPSLKDEDAQG